MHAKKPPALMPPVMWLQHVYINRKFNQRILNWYQLSIFYYSYTLFKTFTFNRYTVRLVVT